MEQDPFLPKSEALTYFRKRDYITGGQDEVHYATGQRGLACECCTYHCEYEELQEYCIEPSISNPSAETSLPAEKKSEDVMTRPMREKMTVHKLWALKKLTRI